MQKDGLDAVGANDDNTVSSPLVEAELIQGKRETIYWEKVPTKVKQDALSLSGYINAGETQSDSVLNNEKSKGKKRKR